MLIRVWENLEALQKVLNKLPTVRRIHPTQKINAIKLSDLVGVATPILAS